MISAGRVLLMPKGDYDPTTTYELLDIVSYNGSSYIAKGTTTGNLPTNTTYWQLSAYGGQASNLAGNFAPLETTEYATRAYTAGDIFVDKDSQLVTATTTINIGDEIVIGSNCDATTIAELLDAIENRYDALDQRNRKLVGINPITIQTDLHQLAPGEYFKKLTTFYVTNAPTGINQVPTAVFRLTVESGLDESSSSMLLTLRTIDGKVYTQSYDGTSWSPWVEAASKAYVDNGLALKANSADLGTAAEKNSTNVLSAGSTDLIESGAVHSAIQTLSNQISDSDDAYSSSKAYKVGDLVIHDDVLYRCITACSAAAWSVNQSCFTEDTLTNAVGEINGKFKRLAKTIINNGSTTLSAALDALFPFINESNCDGSYIELQYSTIYLKLNFYAYDTGSPNRYLYFTVSINKAHTDPQAQWFDVRASESAFTGAHIIGASSTVDDSSATNWVAMRLYV